MKRIQNLIRTSQVGVTVVCLVFWGVENPGQIAQAACIEKEPFFYESTGKVFLDLLPETVGVKFVDGTTFDEVKEVAQKHNSKPVEQYDLALWELKVPPDLCPRDFIILLNQEEIVEFATPVYLIGQQKSILLDQFVVQFVPELDEADIKAFNAQHHVEMVRKTRRPSNTYILKVTKDSEVNALEMANLYHEQDLTLWAQPEFLARAVATAVKGTSRHFVTTWASLKGKR